MWVPGIDGQLFEDTSRGPLIYAEKVPGLQIGIFDLLGRHVCDLANIQGVPLYLFYGSQDHVDVQKQG